MTQPTASGLDQFNPTSFTVVEPRTFEGGQLSIIASDRTSADGRIFHSELIWLRV
jgi:hypothetical protein